MSTELNRSVVRATAGSLIILTLALSACTTVRQQFPGRDAGQVWTAVEAVAQSPEYRDWHVMENHVWVDDEEARIEVFRVLQRSYHAAGQRAWNQRQQWRFQVLLEDRDPPTVTFVSRGIGIPARANRQGRQFFSDVRRLLRADMPHHLINGEPLAEHEPRRPPADEPRPEREVEPAAPELDELLEPEVREPDVDK